MGLFAQEIARYLDCFDAGLTLTDFAEIDSTGRPAPEHRGLFYRILRLEPVNPRRRTWQEIVARLQAIYDQASKVETPGPATRRQDLREKLAQADIKFLDHSNGQCRVSPVALRELYDTARSVQTMDSTRPEAAARVTVEIHVDADNDETVLQAIDRLMDLLSPEGRARLELLYGIYRKSEGSTVITAEVSAQTATHLVASVEHARQQRLPGPEIRVVVLSDTPGRRFFDPRRIEPSPDPSLAAAQFKRLWRQISIRDALVRPWRRLWWLMSPAVATSPLARVIGRSDATAYASPGAVTAYGGLLRRELVMAWVVWPMLTVVLIALTLWPLRGIVPDLAYRFGMLSGLLLGLAGGQVCACVVAPTAAGAGGIVLGWAFGVTHALAYTWFGTTPESLGQAIAADPFTALNGGPIGLAAPGWRQQLQPILIAVVLAAIGGAISASGWFMAQPMNAGPHTRTDWPAAIRRWIERVGPLQLLLDWPSGRIDMIGGLLGFLAGGAIGVLRGLSTVLRSLGLGATAALAVSFATVGAVVFGATIYVARGRPALLCSAFALGYAALTAVICLTVQTLDAPYNLLLLTAGTAIYHATWFTAAFVVGAQFSRNAAIIATTLEGTGGFLGFVLFRLFAA